MNNKKIFMVGGSGLVGSRVGTLLSKEYTIDQLSLTQGIDITDPKTLDPIRSDTSHDVLIHMAAKADVDGCEQDRLLGEDGSAYQINVQGTQNVIDACKKTNKKIVYISTDFVFDGEQPPTEGYTEESPCNPLNWYGQTKYEGENRVRQSGLPFLIARIAYPFRQDEFPAKKDFLHAIMGRLKEGKEVRAVTDHVMTPTVIDDIAQGLATLITANATGTYHLVGSQSLTPYDASLLIAENFGYDKSLITSITREEYFAGKANRPFNLSLNNDKIEKVGAKMRTFGEGLRLLL